jgi:hypothetical protein
MPELIINALASTTGWTADAGITVETQGFSDHISGYNAASIALRIAAGSSGKSATLALTSQDVAPYQWISFSAVSFRKGIQGMRHLADAQYSIELATGQVFYVPISSEFTRVWIPVDGYAAVTKFKVKALHSEADFLVFSNLRATRDDFPADVLNSVKAGIELQRDRIAPGHSIGTVTGAAGDLAIDIEADWSWVEKNVVLLIGSGASAEDHILANVAGNHAGFNQDDPLINDHTDSPVLVTFPVDVGYVDREAKLPGVAVWYSSPTPTPRHSRADIDVLCWGPLGVYKRRDGATMNWRIGLEIAARSHELVADATMAVRAFLATSIAWVHGVPLWFEWTEPSVDTEPIEGYDIVPRASYVFDIEVKEDSWQLQKLTTGNPVLSVTPLSP